MQTDIARLSPETIFKNSYTEYFTSIGFKQERNNTYVFELESNKIIRIIIINLNCIKRGNLLMAELDDFSSQDLPRREYEGMFVKKLDDVKYLIEANLFFRRFIFKDE